MDFIRWLLPGSGIKRWLLMSCFGVVIMVFGISALCGLPNLPIGKIGILRFVNDGWEFVIPMIVTVLLAVAGAAAAVFGFDRFIKSIVKVLAPKNNGGLFENIYRERFLERGPKIVAMGGGTGLSALLRGLKEYTSNITAVVTVTDDGGSSGILKADFDVLPPGDIRDCLVALADTESSMHDLFNYRFDKGQGLAGHSLGNLLLIAVSEMKGDFYGAVKEIAEVLAIRGRVIPSTLTKVTLCARTRNGRVIQGETKITAAGEEIEQVFLKPDVCHPPEDALEAIMDADAVILGPGSLYTSIIPNLLVGGVNEALDKTKAKIIYICNVMTQHGETEGYDAQGHLKALQRHLGNRKPDYIVVNVGDFPDSLLEKYRAEGSHPVKYSTRQLENMGVEVIKGSFAEKDDFIRHDSKKLARAILSKLGINNGGQDIRE